MNPYNLCVHICPQMTLKNFTPTIFTTKEAVSKLGLHAETLRRYRKDNILKRGIDWEYGDAYGRTILYNFKNVQKAIHEHASKRLETV